MLVITLEVRNSSRNTFLIKQLKITLSDGSLVSSNYFVWFERQGNFCNISPFSEMFTLCLHFPVPSSPTFFFLYVHSLVTSSQWSFGISDKVFLQHMKETQLVAPGGWRTVVGWFSLPHLTYGTCKFTVLIFVSFGQLRFYFLLICFFMCRGMMTEPPETVVYLYHKYCILSHHQYISVSIPI